LIGAIRHALDEAETRFGHGLEEAERPMTQEQRHR
jgi:hypothetical protein